MKEDAPQRNHSLREVFNGLRYIVQTGMQWRKMPDDLPPWVATGESVEVAFVDQGYTGDQAAADAAEHGIRLEVVKLPTA